MEEDNLISHFDVDLAKLEYYIEELRVKEPSDGGRAEFVKEFEGVETIAKLLRVDPKKGLTGESRDKKERIESSPFQNNIIFLCLLIFFLFQTVNKIWEKRSSRNKVKGMDIALFGVFQRHNNHHLVHLRHRFSHSRVRFPRERSHHWRRKQTWMGGRTFHRSCSGARHHHHLHSQLGQSEAVQEAKQSRRTQGKDKEEWRDNGSGRNGTAREILYL